jgi:hypothetical protein
VDPFTFTRQTIAFLGVLAVIELAIFLLFPIAIVVLAALAALLWLIVWLKTGIRARKWFWWNPVTVPLTQIEGALALSAVLLLCCGILVAGYEAIRFASGERQLLLGYVWRYLQTDPPANRPLGSHSQHYSDPAMQQEFKDELAKAGIPHSLDTREGKEYIVWKPQDNAAVEEIQRKVTDSLSLNGRNVSFKDPETQREFREWLVKRGIPHEVVTQHGREVVVWKDGSQDLPRQFMNERSVRCKHDATASAAGEKAEVKRC